MKSKLLAALIAIGLCADAYGYEEPDFSVVGEMDGVEFRQYEPYLVAETVVDNAPDRDAAANAGFRRLFKYISGDNTEAATVADGAAVKQTPVSTRIDMTAPVRQAPLADGWAVAFIVPREFDAQTVPQPTNPDVYIRTVPGELMAVVRFSGRWTDRNVDAHKAELLEKLAASGLTPRGDIVTAFYNAPFALPPFRRNEVMVRVDAVPETLASR